MSILITGGTGFLGSYLARHLVLEKGQGDVVLFDQFPDRLRVEEVEDRVTLVQGDVLEVHELLSTMKRHRVDRVVHLAAILGGPTPERIVPYLRVQSMGTANVFEACRIHGVNRVVFASSVAVHGYKTNLQPEVDEDAVPRPDSPYGICKLWGEHVADFYHRVHGRLHQGLIFDRADSLPRRANLRGPPRDGGAGEAGGDAAGPPNRRLDIRRRLRRGMVPGPNGEVAPTPCIQHVLGAAHNGGGDGVLAQCPARCRH